MNISVWTHKSTSIDFLACIDFWVTKMDISETENLMSYFYSGVILTNIHTILVSEILGTKHQKDCKENRKVVSIKELWKAPLS